ncbi:MAG TPA: PKD domain-containing protein [Thermoplasmata archaeon]|nr:PKD domain-containing protein [Thermoplasmata archaeon]
MMRAGTGLQAIAIVVAAFVLLVPNLGWSGVTPPATASPPPRDGASASLPSFLPSTGAGGVPHPASGSAGGWVNITTPRLSGSPAPRMYASSAFDPQFGGIVVFGGLNNSSRTSPSPAYNDTWLFSNGTWTNLTAQLTGAPSARWAASLTWDAKDGYLLLFGGRLGGNATVAPRFLNDTWALDPTGWSLLSPSLAPPARGFAPLAYDPPLNETILFSGGDVNFANGTISPFHDTWTYVGGVWTNITATSGAGAGQASAMAYDPSAGGVIATGIMRPDSICAPLNQTWLFSGGVWTKLLNTSSPIPGGTLTYDAVQGKLVYVGGCVTTGHAQLPLTWEYANGTWANVTSLLTSSEGTACCATLSYDPIQKVSVLFGGNRLHPTPRNGYVNWGYSFPIGPLAVTLQPNRTIGATPLHLQLNSLRSGGVGPYTFRWQLGDGSPDATSQNVSHVYTTLGVHVVNYTVTDSQGRSVNRSISITVGPTYSLTASSAPTQGEAPARVTVNATAQGGFTPYRYVWNFSDGGQLLVANGSHVFASSGTYAVVLTATDAAGDCLLYNSTVNVAATVNGSVSLTPTVGVAPLSVTFAATPVGGAAPYTFAWTFGDGSTGSGAAVSHTYTATGTYGVILNITDGYGYQATQRTGVSVVNALSAQASAGPNLGVEPLPVTFTGTSSGGVAPFTYSWAFGDGSSGSGAAPSHTYASAGNYTAVVTVGDAINESTTASVLVQVVQPLAVHANPATVHVAPITIPFTPTVVGGAGPYHFAWNFGDSATGVGGSVSHTYTAAGTYDAAVTVTDGLGEVATNSTTVTVVNPLSATVAANVSTLTVGGSVTLTATALAGYGSLSYVWSGLPTGCSGAQAATVVCVPSGAGSFNVSVEVSDGLSEHANASTVVVVNAVPSGPAGSSTGLSGGLLWIVIGLILVIVVIGALAYVLLRRPPRPAPARPVDETGPTDISGDLSAETEPGPEPPAAP